MLAGRKAVRICQVLLSCLYGILSIPRHSWPGRSPSRTHAGKSAPPERCCIINCPTVNCPTGAVAWSEWCCKGVARSSLQDVIAETLTLSDTRWCSREQRHGSEVPVSGVTVPDGPQCRGSGTTTWLRGSCRRGDRSSVSSASADGRGDMPQECL